jgi:hypothetical protein
MWRLVESGALAEVGNRLQACRRIRHIKVETKSVNMG